MGFLINIIEQAGIFGIMAVGVYITYSILDFPDLSVDGSFPLGGAVAAALIVNGVNPWIATVVAIIAGAGAGWMTGFLHVKCKITNLLSGILVMIGLYSINLRVMGKSNIPLLDNTTIFSSSVPRVLVIVTVVFIVKVAMDLFFKTKMGFVLKTTGDNPQMVTSLGVDIGKTKIMGLMMANALVALSGAIMVQSQRFADINMGTGTIVMGLASIIIGQSIFKKLSLFKVTTIVLIGSFIYRSVIALALYFRFPTNDIKLATAIIVVIAITINNNNFSLKDFGAKRREKAC
ncbi:MAG TPA: ABC transporter permease [Epulopiscium sp.]|nr:ABC transporter permease [Candidatus Epulonipiscium sp.]